MPAFSGRVPSIRMVFRKKQDHCQPLMCGFIIDMNRAGTDTTDLINHGFLVKNQRRKRSPKGDLRQVQFYF